MNPVNETDTMKVYTMKQSDIKRCPFVILTPDHYFDNGQCRCTDSTHKEMREWGYKWSRTQKRWLSYSDEPSINLKTAKNVNKCIEYLNSKPSKDDYEQAKRDRQSFTKMMTETQFKAKFMYTAAYFSEDKEQRDIWRITIKRNGETISFTFGASMVDTWEHKEPDLYDILAGVDLDYRVVDQTFEEFCDEIGMDTDSIKDKKTYDRCVVQSKKLQKIFTETEIWSMPS